MNPQIVVSQLSSEKLLFAVDGDLYRVKTGQCAENERLWTAQLQTEVYTPHYPHKVQTIPTRFRGLLGKRDKMMQEEESGCPRETVVQDLTARWHT